MFSLDQLDMLNSIRDPMNRAIALAAVAHDGQKRRSGESYIWHPIRVAQLGFNNNERIVGFLHDIVEDTDVTLENLAELKFSEEVIDAVALLTRHDDGSDAEYETYIRRIARNKLATEVKINDLSDNQLCYKDRYRKAYEFLTGEGTGCPE